MSRCKACDVLFTDSNFINSEGFEEDLCSYCRYLCRSLESSIIHEYQFESLTEIPVYVENYQNTVDK